MAKTQKRSRRKTSRKTSKRNTSYSKRQSFRKSSRKTYKKVNQKLRTKNKRNIRRRTNKKTQNLILIGGGIKKTIRKKINEFQEVLEDTSLTPEGKVYGIYKIYEELYKIFFTYDLENYTLSDEELKAKIRVQRSELVDFLRFSVETVKETSNKPLIEFIISTFKKVGKATSNFLTERDPSKKGKPVTEKNREHFEIIQENLAFTFFLLVKMIFMEPGKEHTLEAAQQELMQDEANAKR